MHADMHMNLYTGRVFFFFYFMNSRVCVSSSVGYGELSLFSQQGVHYFFLQIKETILTWNTYAESILIDKLFFFFNFKQLNKTRRMLLCIQNHSSRTQKCWSWDCLLQHNAVFANAC